MNGSHKSHSVDGGLGQPIFKGESFDVISHEEFAVPGLYKITPHEQTSSITDLDGSSLQELATLQQQLRKGLKERLGVLVCGLYVEEHPNKAVTSLTAPLHIDRLQEQFQLEEYQPHIAAYLQSYSATATRREASRYNNTMRDFLAEPHNISVAAESHHADELTGDILPIQETLDIYSELELPQAPDGMKYYVCLGGTKNFQAFLCDKRLSKGEFLQMHESAIDDCLKPVYQDEQVTIRQDAKYALPGFYIISPNQHYRSIDAMPAELYQHCLQIARQVRQGLTDSGITQAHIYHDEKYQSPASAHLWALPIHRDFIHVQGLNPTIASADIWKYLETFPQYNATKNEIAAFNEKMRQFLAVSDSKYSA